MDSEAGVFSITFDITGTRMITTEADKTIKVYKEDDTAVNRFDLNNIPYTHSQFDSNILIVIFDNNILIVLF